VDRVVSDASFLFTSDHNLSLDEILPSLPSQPICDMLLSWYFNSRFMVLGKEIFYISWNTPLIRISTKALFTQPNFKMK